MNRRPRSGSSRSKPLSHRGHVLSPSVARSVSARAEAVLRRLLRSHVVCVSLFREAGELARFGEDGKSEFVIPGGSPEGKCQGKRIDTVPCPEG